MAEFQKIMNILKRQYESMGLYDFDYARMEEDALKWAAEHPEPVYPTWEEWLEEVGFVKKTIMKDFVHREYCWKEPIPADIAQKLGIEPKEG